MFAVVAVAVGSGAVSRVEAQCQMYFNTAYERMGDFLLEGQVGRVLLKEGETGEFMVTFYSGFIYRIAIATGPNKDKAIFELYDEKYNLVFSNQGYDLAQWWDFSFNSTGLYYLQVRLLPGAVSGCIVSVIGYKRLTPEQSPQERIAR